MNHKVRQCVPWCGNPDCVHVDAAWHRRDPWNRSTAEIYAQANTPEAKLFFNRLLVGLAAFVIFAGIFTVFCR